MSLLVSTNLYLILEIAELLLFYFGILKLKFQRKKWISVLALISIFVCVNTCLWWSGAKYLDAAITPVCLLTVFLISDLTVSKRLLCFYIAELLLSVFNQTPVFLLMIKYDETFFDWKQSGFWGMICNSTFLLLEIILILVLRKYKSLDWGNLFGKYQLISFLIGLHCSVVVMVVNRAMIVNKEMRTTSKILFGLSVFFVVLIFMTVSVWLGIQQHRNQYMELQQKHMTELIALQEQQYKMLLKSDEHMRRFRHDMRAHFSVLRELSVKNHIEDVESYINQIDEILLSNNTQIYTGIVGIDAVLNDLKQEIVLNDIHFSFYGKIIIRDEIREYDLCTIFYNGLKNAIEACCGCDEKRVIEVSVGNYDKKISIRIKNTCKPIYDDVETYLSRTTKVDKKRHGMGIRSMKLSVERYNGIIRFGYIDGWFETMVLL